ncbi:MAG: hypothetical protein BMS9Abin07_1548 [Acidimicrobiia bacterium]|nr:MAG: hypothetical protein BMS9Abin07_1548 [Acidimicrobiia bacterium]
MTGRVRLVTVDRAAPSPNVELVSGTLRSHGYDLEPLPIPARGLPRGISSSQKRIQKQFIHTPAPLIESWRVGQHVIAATEPGDVIVIADAGGVGGVLALLEAAEPAARRRQVWTLAGDGVAIRRALIAGTMDGDEMPEASMVDWELVQYRNSAEVLATSQAAAKLLDDLGVTAHLAVEPQPPASVDESPIGSSVWAPGPVSRANQSGPVMRAVASVQGAHLTVSNHDADDHIWIGSTWDALHGIRSVLGNRLDRSDRPTEKPAYVVVGDTLVPPDPTTGSWREAGVPVLVPRGSVAAARWPDAPTWADEDEFAALLGGAAAAKPIRDTAWPGPAEPSAGDASRALRVSVGVPVFGSVEFLDECMESILAQDQPPHEVVLIDDGSVSAAVDAALTSWRDAAPDVVRIDRQPNRGVCVARNRLIESMTGDAFLLVDQDDVLDPRFISSTAEALRQDPSLWAVATWTEFFGDYEGIEAKPPFDRRVGIRENSIVSTAALVDMDARDRGIRFAPDLAFLYCEDWHVWSQIIAAGGRMGLVPEPLIRHRVHRASGGFQRTELAHRIGRARAIEPLLGSDRS